MEEEWEERLSRRKIDKTVAATAIQTTPVRQKPVARETLGHLSKTHMRQAAIGRVFSIWRNKRRGRKLR